MGLVVNLDGLDLTVLTGSEQQGHWKYGLCSLLHIKEIIIILPVGFV